MENKELDNIVKGNIPKLNTYVRGRVGSKDDAEDIVQETLYLFLRTMRTMDNPIMHVTSWLYTVAHNLIINHGKKRREESLIIPKDDDGEQFMNDLTDIMMADEGENPDIRMLRSMVWEEFDKALSELPEEQKEAFKMTEINGMSVKEAAEKSGVSQNTILSRKHYAVLHIRKRMYGLYIELTNTY